MNISGQTEEKIEQLLREMTIDEKVAFCHGNSKFYADGCARLGIGELALMDGPHGVRSEVERDTWTCLDRDEDRGTYLPPETALAATFDPELAWRFGETLGSEARSRGKDIILGPGLNIMRTPLCGRNFEVYARYRDPEIRTPLFQLCGISSNEINAGQAKTLTLEIPAFWVKAVNEKGERVTPRGKICFFVGSHQPDERSNALCGDPCLRIDL